MSVVEATLAANQCELAYRSGMSLVSTNYCLNALEQFRTDILQASQDAKDNRSVDNKFVRPGKP